jgi:hypothetical protein
MRDRRCAAALSASLLLAVGCSHGGGDSASGGLVHERRGSYGGIAMGASEQDVRRVFGEPGGGQGFFPLGESFAEIGGPPAVSVWPPGTRKRATVLRYDGVAFLVGSRGVFAFVVTAEGARTRMGVAIGDRLRDARRRYRLGCGEGVGGEPLFGGETPTYPYCRGTIGDRIRIWFGQDPIRSITLARVGR